MIKRKNAAIGTIVALSVVALAGCSPESGTGGKDGSSEPSVGPEITYYSGTGLQTDLVDALAGPFADYMDEKYGVPVRVNNVVGAIPNSWAALQTEWPNPSGDAYLLYNDQVRQGIEDGWWVKLQDEYSEDEWQTFDQDALETLNTQGYTAPQDISAYILAVQNSVPDDAVTSWADLGDEQFANRVTLDSALAVGSGYNPIAAAVAVLGDDWRSWFEGEEFHPDRARPAFELVGEWADNAITLTEGSGSITPLLSRGEALVSAWWWHNTTQLANSGQDVRAVAPDEGAMAFVQSGPVVSRESKNPIAAVEWVKFYHSEVAAELALEMDYINRLPRESDPVSPEFKEFTETAEIVWIDELRDALLDPAYNQEVLDLYSEVVIQRS